MSPLDFVGIPDWRSAALALIFAAPWLILLAGRRLRSPWLWGVVALGVVLFPISIAWVQVPIQQGLNTLWLNFFPVATIQRYMLLLGIPSIIVAGLVQEVVKFLIGVAGLYLIHERKSPGAGIALGAAAGAGYGAMEAFWVFNQIFAAGFTLGTIQLAGISALLGFIERFFTIMFHTGAASLSTYGYASRRPWRFLLLAIALHSLTDYMILPLRAGLISNAWVEIVTAVVAVSVISAALWMRARLNRASDLDAGSD
ncbi:MAG: YhfC family glutamic-type intramembrane protease [Anaerolineales bacterium]